MVEEKPMKGEWLKSFAEAWALNTDKLIVVGIVTYLIYGTYMNKIDPAIVNTAIGGLIGYLGASQKKG